MLEILHKTALTLQNNKNLSHAAHLARGRFQGEEFRDQDQCLVATGDREAFPRVIVNGPCHEGVAKTEEANHVRQNVKDLPIIGAKGTAQHVTAQLVTDRPVSPVQEVKMIKGRNREIKELKSINRRRDVPDPNPVPPADERAQKELPKSPKKTKRKRIRRIRDLP